MNTNNFPENLYDFYSKNPSMFEERIDSMKRIINRVLLAVCVLLVIFPSIIPIGDWLIRIVAIIGLLYFGFSAFFGGKNWYSLASGGVIKDLAIKKFANPPRGTMPGCEEDRRIIDMFDNDDFAALAAEPDANDRPMQLYIHEDAAGKTFYLQLRRYFSSSDFRGVTEVKVLKEPQYSQFYSVIKSIKST
jgi:hypothetical protein